jgi:cystathionine beta-lyase
MNSPGTKHRSAPLKVETALVTAGRDTKAQKGFVNPPVVHGSTVLYPTAEDLHAHRGEFQYGRHGTPTTKALAAGLDGARRPACAGVGLVPSGLSAITTTLLAVLKAGDHLLVCDNVYRPSRNFCNGLLARFGVETSYFDPLIGAGIDALFKPNTKAVLVEAPGSQSFEMPDIPAIASVAHARGALVIDDNTWATPLFHRSLDQGVDISIQAATKYIGGHSDIMFGTISANAKTWPPLSRRSGCSASAPAPMTCSWRYAVCARSRCGSRSITRPGWTWRDGWRRGPRWSGCCIRRWKAIPAMRSGNGILPAPPACSVLS